MPTRSRLVPRLSHATCAQFGAGHLPAKRASRLRPPSAVRDTFAFPLARRFPSPTRRYGNAPFDGFPSFSSPCHTSRSLVDGPPCGTDWNCATRPRAGCVCGGVAFCPPGPCPWAWIAALLPTPRRGPTRPPQFLSPCHLTLPPPSPHHPRPLATQSPIPCVAHPFNRRKTLPPPLLTLTKRGTCPRRSPIREAARGGSRKSVTRGPGAGGPCTKGGAWDDTILLNTRSLAAAPTTKGLVRLQALLHSLR